MGITMIFLITVFVIITCLLVFRVITRNNQISPEAALVNTVLTVIKPKKILLYTFKNSSRTSKPLKPSKRFTTRYQTKYHSISGTETITTKPRNMKPKLHLIYFHGGAYVLGKNGFTNNESFISKLVEGTESKVTFVDYPVAPEHKFNEVLDSTSRVYNHLATKYNEDSFILVGDSAGGGLALALAQRIVTEKGLKQPSKIVLFSPWLDLSLEDVDREIEGKDMILSTEALNYAAKQYASNSVKSPIVSPIYGEFTELGKVLMFFGTFELFYPDGLRMQKIAQFNNLDIRFKFYDEMFHDWVLFPIPEAEHALYEAFNFILS